MRTCGVFTICKYEIEAVCGKPIFLIPIGDIHRESPLFYDVEYFRTLGWIEKMKKDKDKDLIVLGMGDYLDAVSSSERKIVSANEFHETTITGMDSMSHNNIRLLYEELKFLKGNWAGLLGGNHYWTYANGSTSDNELAEMLGANFLGVQSFIRITLKQTPKSRKRPSRICHVDIMAHHGTSAPRTMAASMAAVVRMAEGAEADIFLQGHDHKRFIFPGQTKLKLEGDLPYYRDRTLWFGRTGAFLRGMVPNEMSYAVDRLLPPTQLGVIRIEMIPKREGNHLAVDIHGSV
jgi:hypothetical protein